MTFQRFHTSVPDQWTKPRPNADPSMMLYKHGPIRPMEDPGLIARLTNLMADIMRRP